MLLASYLDYRWSWTRPLLYAPLGHQQMNIKGEKKNRGGVLRWCTELGIGTGACCMLSSSN